MSEIVRNAARMLSFLPEEDQQVILAYIKKFVLQWDPDFEKATAEEYNQIAAAESSGFVDEEDVDWEHLGQYTDAQSSVKFPVMTGNEQFRVRDRHINRTVKDFWAWSMSRLLADGPRGDLAEYIVNTALGMDTTIAKRGWGECDIVYKGVRIEIKCSSLLQAWDRDTPSKPVFSIGKTLNCDVQETESGYRYVGRDGLPAKRRSELYIFCLFSNAERKTADPMDLDQWKFFVVPTNVINDECGNNKSISLKGITKLGVSEVVFDEIKSVVDAFISENESVHGPFDSTDELMKDLNSD